jgi:hypothetical protein
MAMGRGKGGVKEWSEKMTEIHVGPGMENDKTKDNTRELCRGVGTI